MKDFATSRFGSSISGVSNMSECVFVVGSIINKFKSHVKGIKAIFNSIIKRFRSIFVSITSIIPSRISLQGISQKFFMANAVIICEVFLNQFNIRVHLFNSSYAAITCLMLVPFASALDITSSNLWPLALTNSSR